ncbi:titin-like isoform X2 [Maniola jurtina]|uniref:titin-like isoform X2 n=1 Tax=Maniola jurtina TaxID=191418 RepID=UPI001E68D569|nr:titin-like isoform X2 [Maniola jurtina]
MGDKDDYLTSYRVFFENFAATVDPEDQLPVNIAGYTITEAEVPGEVIYWTTQYLTEKQCPPTLMTHLQRIILDEVRIASKKHPNEFGYNSDESEYIALRLMQAVTARVNDVCLRYLDNARLDTLPPPPPQSLKEYKTVSSATKNSRRVMEDRHVEIANLEALFGIETTEPTSFYAVYDGHAGSAAATYCAAHLHQYLVESPHFARDLRQATHDAYLRTDAEFIRKSNQKRASGGSTAVSVAVRGRRLVAAWAGDSLALLAKRMRLMQLVNPHKPDRPDEKERIESTGGTVMYWGTWRVNGQLAVSRAIGDAQYKPYVTARPEIVVVELDGDEDFVVVGCDGLWDVLSEDAVALSVYKQLCNDRDDLKAVPKNLVRQAKRAGSEDNISVIVVFLKDPRDIIADNCPPMDLGLDNARVTNVPPFVLKDEACKTVVAETGGGDCAEGGDNGVSDSDSEDLGPETAVDADLDVDDDAELRDEPAPPTPPAHAVESSHVDGNLADNVAESGEESEDEWNYFKGEGEREQIPSEENDEPPRSETPGQDNSAWESSSVDMNSSPLNPDAPVFVPGGVGGSDVLLAESPRKPMPMDDIELPDANQFKTEAVVRPAELQDLDNCDQLNGHHNISMEGVTEHLNGNDKDEMESLGFGFNVGIEKEKVKDNNLIQDFERIQKDTTDFCNIQVFPAHTETNPFNTDVDDEFFERLKNKERDPMSMSFYQEKDDDTCERFGKLEPSVDLNAVQPLPDSDDEDMQPNGGHQSDRDDKENVCPSEKSDLFNLEDGQEPNNDRMRFDEQSDTLANNITNLDNFMDFNVNSTNNIQNYSNTEFECNIQESVVQTDTPESHKLLFEQIPEIPDGKSSELGFTNEDLLEPSESERDARAITPQDETSQDIEMESKLEESPSEEVQAELAGEVKDELAHSDHIDISETSDHVEQLDIIENEITNEITESETTPDLEEKLIEQFSNSPEMDHENVVVDVHKEPEFRNFDEFDAENKQDNMTHDNIKDSSEFDIDTEIRLETEQEVEQLQAPVSQMPGDSPIQSPAPSETLLPNESLLPRDSPLRDSPAPQESLLRESPLPQDTSLPESSPLPQEDLSVLRESPLPQETQLPSESPLPQESQLPHESPEPSESPLPQESQLLHESPEPSESPLPQQLQLPHESPVPSESPLPTESPVPSSVAHLNAPEPTTSPLANSPLPTELEVSESIAPAQSPLPLQSPEPESKLPAQDDLEPPVPAEIPLPRESPLPSESPLPDDAHLADSSLLRETSQTKDTFLSESPLPIETTINEQVLITESQIEPQIESQIEAQLNSQQILEFEQEISVPDDIQRESPLPVDNIEERIHRSPLPVEQNFEETFSREQQEFSAFVQESVEKSVPEQPCRSYSASPLPVEAQLQAQSPINRHIESPVCEPLRDSPLPVESVATETLSERLESFSPAPVDTIATPEPTKLAEPVALADEPAPVAPSAPLVESVSEVVPPQESEVKSEQLAEMTTSTPDIVPEERPRNELVTDIDIGIPESRAQEICVPVTSEIQHEDVVRPGATPPPTPAVGDAPIAAAVAVAATAAAATAAAAAAITAKAAKPSSPKKASTTPAAKTDSKATPKSTAARTPTSAKRVASATTAARSPAPRAPAARSASAKASPAAPRAASKPAASPVKSAPSPAKPTAASAKPTAASAKPTTASTKSATLPGKTAAKPAPRAAAAPVPRTTAAPRPAPITRSAPKAPATKPATAPSKPMTATLKATTISTKMAGAPPKTTAAPKTTTTAPKTMRTALCDGMLRGVSAEKTASLPKAKAPGPPQPLTNGDVKTSAKPAPITRAGAARPAPPRPTAPKPASRAPLDKQSKDLANKRITAKAAPPRTAPNKAPVGIKGTKAVTKRQDNKKDTEAALTNGAPEACKAPPSPPADALPDVIA